MVGTTVSHFEIIDEIGGGGMGVVYRARDLKLDRLVALKFLAPEFQRRMEDLAGGDLESRTQRFIHEAQTASALDHPNIYTIHAIEETEDGQLFIAMAYYEGETLREKIGRGPLPVGEVIEYGAQAAAGLAAAHDRGILHRDIKPANLMVTNDGVVKVLDFGLSKFIDARREGPQKPDYEGTAGYMSPEQVRELPIDHRSDIWSLGVVLFELSTGVRPFQGGNEMSVLYAVANHEPVFTPQQLERVPSSLRAIIARALTKEPSARYQTAQELYADLDGLRPDSHSAIQSSVTLQTLWRQRRRQRWRQRVAVAALALVALSALAVSLWRQRASPVSSVPRDAATALALGLSNRSAEADGWVCRAFSELLVQALPERPGLRWQQPGDAARRAFQAPGGYTDSRGIDGALLQRLRGQTDAARVVTGQCLVQAEQGMVDIELTLQDLESGDISTRIPMRGKVADLIGLTEEVAMPLAAALGVSPPEPGVHPAPLSGSLQAALESARRDLRVLNAPGALRTLSPALEQAPRSRALLGARAEALIQAGRMREARAAALTALQATRQHPLTLRAADYARMLEARGEQEAAAAIWRALWAGLPAEAPQEERGDLGLHLAGLLAPNNGEAAAVVLEELTASGFEASPWQTLVEATVARTDGRNQEQLTNLDSLLTDTTRRETPLLWAQARRAAVQPLRRLGRRDEALVALEEARACFLEHDHEAGIAETWNEQGIIEWDREDLLAAKESFERSKQGFQAVGNDRMVSRLLMNQALILERLGDMSVASELYGEGIALLIALDDLVGASYALTNHANVLVELGRFVDAERAFAEAFEVDGTNDHVDSEAWLYASYGRFQTVRGELTDAGQWLDRSWDLAMQAGDHIQIADTAAHLGRLRLSEGLPQLALVPLEEARQRLEESEAPSFYRSQLLRAIADIHLAMDELTIARSILRQTQGSSSPENGPSRAGVAISSATLLRRQGDLDGAERELREAVDVLENNRTVVGLARALGELAKVLHRRGDTEGAAAAVTQAEALLADLEAPLFQIPLGITGARVLASTDPSAARRGLENLHAETVRRGFGEFELETRLTLAELEMKTGDRPVGSSRFDVIAREAEKRGLARLAARARAFIAQSPVGS